MCRFTCRRTQNRLDAAASSWRLPRKICWCAFRYMQATLASCCTRLLLQSKVPALSFSAAVKCLYAWCHNVTSGDKKITRFACNSQTHRSFPLVCQHTALHCPLSQTVFSGGTTPTAHAEAVLTDTPWLTRAHTDTRIHPHIHILPVSTQGHEDAARSAGILCVQHMPNPSRS